MSDKRKTESTKTALLNSKEKKVAAFDREYVRVARAKVIEGDEQNIISW